MKKRYLVTLTAQEREDLQYRIRSGKAPAQQLTHARILLKADQAEGGPLGPMPASPKRSRSVFLPLSGSASASSKKASRLPCVARSSHAHLGSANWMVGVKPI